MTAQRRTEESYVLGHSSIEEQRLSRLGQLLYPSTKHLFERAGIAPGMKALDFGCGTGDVSLLLSELISTTGSIVGIDIHPTGLESARQRLRAAGFKRATYLAGDIRDLVLDNDFDAVVGRNVLVYVPDMAETLRACASHLRAGGILVFQELDWSVGEQLAAMPSIPPLVRRMVAWFAGGFRQAGAEMQPTLKFPGAFLDAGLPQPQLSLDGIMGTWADWICYDFLTDALRDLLPKLYEYGLLTEDLDAVTYVEQMREEIRQQRGVIMIGPYINAWTYKPS